ncbi:MAG TPA: hypothetical protein VGJ21_19100 [Terracidiphilus sp.]|jgi:hypothetical protein
MVVLVFSLMGEIVALVLRRNLSKAEPWGCGIRAGVGGGYILLSSVLGLYQS